MKMGIREQVGRYAGRRHFVKFYPESVIPQLIMQESPYAQRMLAAAGPKRAVVKWEKGSSLTSLGLAKSPLLRANKRRILAQLAYAVADHVRLGMMHTDMHGSNIVIAGTHSRKTRQPVRVKIIDYGMALPISAENLDMFMKHSDYHKALGSALAHISRNRAEDERLKRYFEKKFLQRLEEKL